jgi:hypothetical protein
MQWFARLLEAVRKHRAAARRARLKTRERRLRVSLAVASAKLDAEQTMSRATGTVYPVVLQHLVGEHARLSAEMAELTTERAMWSPDERSHKPT